jgi:tetratricopeptide (TPR) repeat protein
MKALVALVILSLPLCPLAGQSLEEDPGRARILFSDRKYADAAAILERIQRRGDPAPADLILLGMCYTELGDLDRASSTLNAAAMISPRSVALLNARGNLAFARKRFPEAVEIFREAHGMDPNDRNAVTGLVASLANAGVELYGKGKVPEARARFEEAIQLDSRSVPALRNLALLELDGGSVSRAAGLLEQALAVSPSDIGLLKLLFLVRNKQGDAAAMLPILGKLISLQPADPEPFAARGRLLEQQGNAAEAAQMFQQAVQKGSQDPLPYLRVGTTRRDRYILHDAVGKAVQLISALQIQASQAVSRARKSQELQGARLITTKIEDVRLTLGSALTLLREIDGDTVFEQDLSRLQSWYPGSVDLLAALGRLYREKERWADSLAAWQRILQDHALDGEAQAGAGLDMEKLGNRDGAIMAYRRALDIDPGSRDLYDALERLSAGRESELLQILLDTSYRETRNALLFREIAKLEDQLGLSSDAETHRARAAQIEAGK